MTQFIPPGNETMVPTYLVRKGTAPQIYIGFCF